MPERTVERDLFVSDDMKGSRGRIFLLISVWCSVEAFHMIVADESAGFNVSAVFEDLGRGKVSMRLILRR